MNTRETFSGAKSKDPYPGGTIKSYTWHWGDGSAPSTSISASHKYKAVGTYTITLSEVDSYGAKSSTTVKVTVGPPLAHGAPETITHASPHNQRCGTPPIPIADGKIRYILELG